MELRYFITRITTAMNVKGVRMRVIGRAKKVMSKKQRRADLITVRFCGAAVTFVGQMVSVSIGGSDWSLFKGGTKVSFIAILLAGWPRASSRELKWIFFLCFRKIKIKYATAPYPPDSAHCWSWSDQSSHFWANLEWMVSWKPGMDTANVFSKICFEY